MFRMCITIQLQLAKEDDPSLLSWPFFLCSFLNQSNFSEISPAWESQGLQCLLWCTLCWWRDPGCQSFRKLDIPDMSSSSDDSLCTFYKTLTHSVIVSLLLIIDDSGTKWRRWDMTPMTKREREHLPTHWDSGVTQLPGTLGLVQKLAD